VTRALNILRLVLPVQQRLGLVLILVLSLGAAGLESIGIGLVLPFLKLVADPAAASSNRWIAPIYHASGVATPLDFVLLSAGVLALVFAIKNAYLAFVSYLQVRVAQIIFRVAARRLLQVYISRPYAFHLTHNSSEIVRIITSDAYAISNALLRPGLIILTETLVAVAITGLLAWIEPLMTLLALLLLGGGTGAIYAWVRPRLRQHGEATQEGTGGMIHWINQSIGALKEIKLSGRSRYFLDSFDYKAGRFVDATSTAQVFQMLPRLALETLAVAGLSGAFAALVWSGRPLSEIVPILATFAAASFRLMPSSSRILVAAGQFHLGGPFLDAVAQVLRTAEEDDAEVSTEVPERRFEQALELRNVGFAYADAGVPALHDVSIRIARGESVGIVGPSGAGKSTLLNLILGLLTPTQGDIVVDGRSIVADPRGWQRRLGFVPQDIYLLDDTIKANVAFGLTADEIDEDRLASASAAARLDELARLLPQGLDTLVGERGARLSGGQRQRVAIARALYHDPDVVVMDEATASLDNESERQIAEAIERLKGKRTFIIVAHRLTTVRSCDRLILISDGRVAGTGTYQELLKQNPTFRQLAHTA
jgi:ABC-type multidrug transport system fused ATPase/permease subunit